MHYTNLSLLVIRDNNACSVKGGGHLAPVPVLHAGALLVEVEAVVVALHHGPVHPELDLLRNS